jgi:PIN domain nuclease of toxin-antitoxin system
MMVNDEVFADTYALICILEGHPGYAPFVDRHLLATIFNLAELHQAVLRKYGMKEAHRQLHKHEHCLTEIPFEVVEAASAYRLTHKKERLSYADCIGYALAMQLNIPFLTGDKQFEGKPNVLFVR